LNPDRDEFVERGGLVEQGGELFRVLAVDDEGVLLTRIKPKPSKNVVYTRSVKWSNWRKHGYKLVFP
jgi:hypothetical protein